MTDIVERLRERDALNDLTLFDDAAIEIEQLRDEIEKLRAQVVALQSSLDAGPPQPGKKTPDALAS